MKITRLNVGVCLELKAAGFPQEDCSGYWTPNAVYDNPREPSEVYHFTHDEETEFDVACPTADELLELLPKVLHQNGFPRFLNVEHQQKWSAGYLRGTEFMIYERGDSPAEALAQLWLKTQGKDGTE